MRLARQLANGPGWYHIIFRTSVYQYSMNAEEYQCFEKLLAQTAKFSGVEVMTFAFWDHRFHLLIRVPNGDAVTDEELVSRARLLYSEELYEKLLKRWALWEKRGHADAVEREKRALRARLFSLSEFCKSIKMRYLSSYKRRHPEIEILWMERFKSIPVPSDEETLANLAAAIHSHTAVYRKRRGRKPKENQD